MSATITEADREAALRLLDSLCSWGPSEFYEDDESASDKDVETAAQAIADARAAGAQSQAPDERVVASAYRGDCKSQLKQVRCQLVAGHGGRHLCGSAHVWTDDEATKL